MSIPQTNMNDVVRWIKEHDPDSQKVKREVKNHLGEGGIDAQALNILLTNPHTKPYLVADDDRTARTMLNFIDKARHQSTGHVRAIARAFTPAVDKDLGAVVQHLAFRARYQNVTTATLINIIGPGYKKIMNNNPQKLARFFLSDYVRVAQYLIKKGFDPNFSLMNTPGAAKLLPNVLDDGSDKIATLLFDNGACVRDLSSVQKQKLRAILEQKNDNKERLGKLTAATI